MKTSDGRPVPGAFISQAREAFRKMTLRAQACVTAEMYRHVEAWNEAHPQKPSRFKALNRKFWGFILRIDAARWEILDRDHYALPLTQWDLSGRFLRRHPEYADRMGGLSELYTILNNVRNLNQNGTSRWVLECVEAFSGIFRENPDITDVDAMIQFSRKQNMARKKYQARMEGISPGVRASLSLGLDEHLKPLLAAYDALGSAEASNH